MPPPERVARPAGTAVPATETRNRTSRSHVYRVTGRSRILRLTANESSTAPSCQLEGLLDPPPAPGEDFALGLSQTGSSAPLRQGQHERTDGCVAERASAQKTKTPAWRGLPRTVDLGILATPR